MLISDINLKKKKGFYEQAAAVTISGNFSSTSTLHYLQYGLQRPSKALTKPNPVQIVEDPSLL